MNEWKKQFKQWEDQSITPRQLFDDYVIRCNLTKEDSEQIAMIIRYAVWTSVRGAVTQVLEGKERN